MAFVSALEDLQHYPQSGLLMVSAPLRILPSIIPLEQHITVNEALHLHAPGTLYRSATGTFYALMVINNTGDKQVHDNLLDFTYFQWLPSQPSHSRFQQSLQHQFQPKQQNRCCLLHLQFLRQ